MNSLKEAIMRAKGRLNYKPHLTIVSLMRSDLRELISAAEQVERAKFSSTELIEARDANFKAHKRKQRTMDDGFEDAYYSGFNEGATWVLNRMMK